MAGERTCRTGASCGIMSNTNTMQEGFDRKVFEVPDYQCSYSWEAKSGGHYTRFHIVNGQQRPTTSVLFFRAKSHTIKSSAMRVRSVEVRGSLSRSEPFRQGMVAQSHPRGTVKREAHTWERQ